MKKTAPLLSQGPCDEVTALGVPLDKPSDPGKKRRFRVFTVVAFTLIVLVTGLSVVSIYTSFVAKSSVSRRGKLRVQSQAALSSFWNQSLPNSSIADDPQAIELGMRFQVNVDGTIYGIRFYKNQNNSGPHSGSLWSAAGKQLATAMFTNESQSGWQELRFRQPVTIKAGTVYTASYHTSSGHYNYTEHFFAQSLSRGALTALADSQGGNGVYRYPGGFPNQSFHDMNYWVDVLFAPLSSLQPTSTAAPPTPTSIAAPPTPIPTSAPSTNPVPGGNCSSDSACGFPDASNTGVPADKILVPYRGDSAIYQDGTVLDEVDITGGLDIYANNVTISNSRITSADIWGVMLRPNYSNLKILHCTFIGSTAQGGGEYAVDNHGGNIEIAYSNFGFWQDAIDTSIGSIHDNYVHDVSYVPGAHTNAFLSEGGGAPGLQIEHNTLLNFDTQGPSGSLSLFADFGAIQDVTVDNNWLAGGNYALYGGDNTASNVKIRNNVFSLERYPQSGYYGPVTHFDPNAPGNVFQGNVFSNGEPVTL